MMLYKVRTDGTDRTRLNFRTSLNICVENDWIYYCTDDYHLYKIRTDGSDETKLSNDNIRIFDILGDWLYFLNGNSELYKNSYGRYRKSKGY